jgi:hypothetical protein
MRFQCRNTFAIGNDTNNDMDLAAGSVLDYWNFSVDSTASFASIVGSVGISGSGFFELRHGPRDFCDR